MALLVNKNTAGTAELFAAAIRDYNKAQIVGSTTYGKGSIQEVTELPEGGANISTGMYLPPSEVSFENTGITPEFEVELPEMYLRNYFSMTEDKDPQLQKAKEVLESIDSDVEY
jgi:carboxyl-terminal processing protease